MLETFARRRVIAVTLVVLASAGPVAGQSTWTGISSNLWSSAANWSPAVVPTSSTDVALVFGASSVTTLIDDLTGGSGPFQLNSLTFSTAAPAYVITGNPLLFRNSSSGVAPFIAMNSTNTITVIDNITLTSGVAAS